MANYKPELLDGSLQGVLDFVAKHLYAMEGPSLFSDDAICRYRNLAGRRCAVGALIADEHYHVSLEGKSACSVVSEVLKSNSLLSKWCFSVDDEDARVLRYNDLLSLLDVLQVAHDSFGGLTPRAWSPEEVYLALSESVDMFASRRRYRAPGKPAIVLTVPAPE